jgi:hypothetical protein
MTRTPNNPYRRDPFYAPEPITPRERMTEWVARLLALVILAAIFYAVRHWVLAWIWRVMA